MGRWLSKFQDSPDIPEGATSKNSKSIPQMKEAGRIVPASELEHRRTTQEITRLMDADGWALVWSDTRGEEIAFAKDEAASAKVPGKIITYSRAELEQILGRGHDPDTLRVIHEAKKHGAKLAGRSKTDA